MSIFFFIIKYFFLKIGFLIFLVNSYFQNLLKIGKIESSYLVVSHSELPMPGMKNWSSYSSADPFPHSRQLPFSNFLTRGKTLMRGCHAAGAQKEGITDFLFGEECCRSCMYTHG